MNTKITATYIIRDDHGRMVGDTPVLLDAMRWAKRIGGTYEIVGRETAITSKRTT
jgi:hypothetical protein